MQHSKEYSLDVSAASELSEIQKDSADLPGRMKLYKSVNGFEAVMGWYGDVTAMIDADVDSKYVATRFGRTHMLVAGPKDAPPLLLIPGISGCAPLWRRQIPEFAKNFRVYALDIVGQPGKSDPITPSYLNDDFSLWLIDVLDSLKIDRAHVAGTSVGGWMALRFGIFAPERINKIVMLSPTGLSAARFPAKIWITKYLNKRKDANSLQDDLTAKSITNQSPGRSFGTFDRQLAKLMALCTRHYRVDRSMGIYNETTQKIEFITSMKVLRKFFFSEPRSYLKKFNVPALLVFGEHEMLYNPTKVAKRAKMIIPGLQTDIIAGAGHAAIYDKPDEVNIKVIDFLKS